VSTFDARGLGKRERLIAVDNSGLVLLSKRVDVTGHFPPHMLEVYDQSGTCRAQAPADLPDSFKSPIPESWEVREIRREPFHRRFCDHATAAGFLKVNGPKRISLTTDDVGRRIIYDYREPGTFESVLLR
jgi:hypothetical protein